MIREALENFQITPNLTENIMREITRLKPIVLSGSKPLVPWGAIGVSTLVVIFLMLGVGTQYLSRFQKPYSFDATSEMTVELIEAPVVLNLEVSKPDIRTQLGNVNTPSKSDTANQQPNNVSAAVADAQSDETDTDYSQWALPKEAKARFGKGGINAIQFSPDGTQLAVGSDIGIWLYDVETGTLFDTPLPPSSVLAFSPDGKKLVTGTREGDVQMWNSETGVAVTSSIELDGFSNTVAPIRSLVFSPNGTLLAVAKDEGIYVLGSDKEIHLKERYHRGARTLVFSPDSTVFVAGLRYGSIELWDLVKGNKLTTLNGHTEEAKMLAFSPDGKTLVSTGEDGTIFLWDWDEILTDSPKNE